MVDAVESGRVPPSPAISAKFAALRRSDTVPEIRLRRELHGLGLRYRVQYRVPGLPRRRVDIAFTRARLVVLVDGCFWHGCPEHGPIPKTNTQWWLEKFERNRLRDRDTDQRLALLGWTVVRVWEHEPSEAAASEIERVYRALIRQGMHPPRPSNR
ncbi:very short patch repair endonuclease [Janibacter sp. Soil728]|uniref:very short patch repair endonuclease n=1 Tax=Janibacter sp. Soil728 TaxID=1736393 RepID=UPI0009E8E145|nr:very short patch repair endonuclease [Janibacter sp. Soil728]